MLEYIRQPALDEAQLYSTLHPELARWFRAKFTHFSPAQLHAVPEILDGHSLLLTSPTGSGKTLAAFLGVFDYLARLRDAGQLPRGIVAIYVSPLRALAYDLRKNLQQPLEELGWDWLTVAARTGDTPMADRAQQKRKPPHILVTTPESLTLLLSQTGWLKALSTVRFVIADELHSLAENKRGVMFTVAAERLEEISNFQFRFSSPEASKSPVQQSKVENRDSKITRIGLSATVAPLETVAEFLVGPGRPCRIAEITQTKPSKIEVFSPLRANAYPPAGYTATRVLEELGDLIVKRETTLIFTNTRSGAETIGVRLKRLLPELTDLIEVHHASLDRSVRLEIEDRLKRGELRAVVCSTSLEMGIDIGSIDTVVMVSAPKGVARALQRIGRSGHSMGRISHGVLVASNINDLAECAVTARMMARRQLEPVKIHENPLDVLAQTIVGLAAIGRINPEPPDSEDSETVGRALSPPARVHNEPGGHKALPTTSSSTGDSSTEGGSAEIGFMKIGPPDFVPITADEIFALVRRTYPYRTLERVVFDRVLRYLRGGGVSLERNYENLFGKVRADEQGNLTLSYPRVAREFYQNIGTINTESMVQVRLRGRPLGQIEESFMKNIRIGDVFVLNGRTVRLVKSHLLTAHVVAADSSLPTVPRWYANKMPLASGLAEEVVRLRTEVAKRLSSDAESVGRALCPPSGKQTGGRKARPTTTDASDRRTPCRGTEAAIDFLRTEYAFSAANARALADHFALQAKISTIPTADKFLVEVYREGDYAHYFFHALIGRSANDAASRIVAQRVQEIKGGNALVSIDDYGFLLSLRSFQTMNEDELKRLFLRAGAEDALRQALSEASLVKWQFRGVAQTGLMVPRRSHGVERGARMLQWSSEIIFDVLRKHEPDHPLLEEAYAEATLRFLDLPRALEFFVRVHALPWDIREIPRVSPFSFGIYVSKIKETMTLEDPETTIERLYHEMYGET